MLWRRLLADLVVVAHAAYFSFVVLGLVAILAGIAFRWKWVRNPWFRWIHLSMIGIVVAEAIAGIPCPLTVWERQLREQPARSRMQATSLDTGLTACCSFAPNDGSLP